MSPSLNDMSPSLDDMSTDIVDMSSDVVDMSSDVVDMSTDVVDMSSDMVDIYPMGGLSVPWEVSVILRAPRLESCTYMYFVIYNFNFI